jgi:hypothetical protein
MQRPHLLFGSVVCLIDWNFFLTSKLTLELTKGRSHRLLNLNLKKLWHLFMSNFSSNIFPSIWSFERVIVRVPRSRHILQQCCWKPLVVVHAPAIYIIEMIFRPRLIPIMTITATLSSSTPLLSNCLLISKYYVSYHNGHIKLSCLFCQRSDG